MPIYSLWNNKGGVGKSYLTFQVAAEYARTHPNANVLVVDLCPQANASGMLLGGIIQGEAQLNEFSSRSPRLTIAGYIDERIRTPYTNPRAGERYVTQLRRINSHLPPNLYLVIGDEQLEVQASRVTRATQPGPADAWRLVHGWITDLISDIRQSWDVSDSAVFIDCNPSFTIYTEMALSASDRLVIPFSADGSSKRAVRAVLSLVYGISRVEGSERSEFFLNSQQFRMKIPQIYCYVGNRLTQSYSSSAAAFKTVVNEISKEIFDVFKVNPNLFFVHPSGQPVPRSSLDFRRMFQVEINDANTASVVSGAMGIPIGALTAGTKQLSGRPVQVN